MPSGSKKEPGPLSIELGKALRAKMAREKVTNKALGEAVGMSPSQVSGVLNAKKNVDVEQLDAMCWSLGLDTLDLLTEVDAATMDRHIAPDWSARPLIRK